VWRERGRQLADHRNGLGTLVCGKHVLARAEQIDEIPSVAAPRVEHRRAWRDAPAKQLIEKIDVDVTQ